VLAQAAGFEDVLELLLAPAAARLGGVAQRIDQLGRLGRDLFLAEPHLLDLALEVAERVAALGLDLGDALFIALQTIADRLEHRLEILPGSFLGLAEACVGAVEELHLRGLERLGGGGTELRGHRVVRLLQLAQRNEVRGLAFLALRLEAGEVALRLVALSLDRIAGGAEEVGVGGLGPGYGEIAGEGRGAAGGQ
jgi:hypothetical protein